MTIDDCRRQWGAHSRGRPIVEFINGTMARHLVPFGYLTVVDQVLGCRSKSEEASRVKVRIQPRWSLSTATDCNMSPENSEMCYIGCPTCPCIVRNPFTP